MKKVKQGHTRWLPVLYEPGTFIDIPEGVYVALVVSCFVTKVEGNSVYYRTHNGAYIAGQGWFLKNTQPTFRKCYRECQRMINKIDDTRL